MKRPRIGVLSRGISRIPAIDKLVDADLDYCAGIVRPRGYDALAGWGRRPASLRARALALRHGLDFIALEDGFLRSVQLGSMDPPCSLVIDRQGIYYDATQPSSLEAMVCSPLDAGQIERARALIAAWRAARVSKYNHLREFAGELPDRYVLVVDQTRGDASIRWGRASQDSFALALQSALEENPDCTVVVKIHPDVFSGRRQAHFDVERLQREQRIVVLAEDVHPVRLIEQAEVVYAVTSQMGFEALLWDRRVRVFGMPFYAGWGLTEDELARPATRQHASIEQLVYAALVRYCVYIDPESGERCEVERLVEYLGWQRKMRARFPAVVHAAGFSLWKRPIVRRFFAGSKLHFLRRPEHAPEGATLAVWGRASRADPAVDLISLEDGFLRSVGLGAHLVQPMSWVMDRRGIYFDARLTSDLEHLLQTEAFDGALLQRAAALRRRIVDAGLTKYNTGVRKWQRPDQDRHVILVPGQVESDASIQFGAGELRHNINLLKVVREAHPEAYLVYKPHPDVVAGLRRRGVLEHQAHWYCDEILSDCAMGDLLAQVDEVHVLTSLAGFEALLRGKSVVCHGQPFYAGWGLTTDCQPCERRSRELDLDALVAGALILYPTYVSRVTGRFCSPEKALGELSAWRDSEAGRYSWRRCFRWIFALMAKS